MHRRAERVDLRKAGDLRYSVIRRSIGFTTAFLCGHVFSFAIFWCADRILHSGDFGLFYASVLAVGVLMSPIVAMTLVLTQRLVEAGVNTGRGQIIEMTWRVLGRCVRIAPLVVVAGVLLAVVVPWVGIEAWQIVLLIPVTVLAMSIAEVLRVSFQSMLMFTRASALWITNIGAQLVFSIGALLLFGKVWTGIAGLFVGTTLTSIIFIPWFVRARRLEISNTSDVMPLRLKRESPLIVSYSLFILLNNIDILLGYFLLSREDLGIYAASALLPKAIITATFAIAQVVLPVVTEQRAGGLSFRLSAIKGVAMAAVMGTLAAGLLWLLMPFIQRSSLAIRGLDLKLMSILAAAAIALSIVRVLIVIEIALKQYTIAFAQTAAIALFVLLCVTAHADLAQIVKLYLIISWGLLLVAGLLLAGIGSAPWSLVHSTRRTPIGRGS
jgi:O-antigen/teichoic acid export membrane protein